MLKFRCQHCGQRIAVGARHLGKLVTCPECGEPTHPLAEQIVSLQGSAALAAAHGRTSVQRSDRIAPPAQPANSSRGDTDRVCANCGQPFGRLQQRVSWQGHCVCAACHTRLVSETSAVEPVGRALPAANAHYQTDMPGAIDAAFATQRVATRPARGPSFAQGAAAAGRLALVGLGGIAHARQLPAVSSDSSGPRALIRTGELDPSATIPLNYSPGLPLTAPALHTRVLIALLIVCLAGAAVYGALSLLRDLAGYLTAAAFILLAAGGGYVLLKASLVASRRFSPLRYIHRATRTPRNA